MADKRRKGSKADAAYRKEVEALAKAAMEKARLMQAAAEAAPTAQQVQAAQQAQEAIEHAPTAQQVQEAQAAQEAFIAAMEGKIDAAASAAQQEEIAQRLMHLPLSRLSLLPKEQQALVWEHLARRIVDMPGFNDALISLAEAERKAAEEFAAIAPALSERIQTALTAAHSTLEAWQPKLQEAMRNLEAWKQANITDDLRQSMHLLGVLAPYMDAEAEEHPELYDENTPASALIAAAARRARADGKDIPQLKAEQPDAEQLEMQLNFPTEDTAKERNQQTATPAPIELARKAGAIMTTGGSVAIISDKDLGYDYFTSAALKLLPGEMSDFILDKETGKINLLSLDGKKLQDPDKLHTAFLMWLLGLALTNSDLREINSANAIIPVYLPPIMREMGIDPRPHGWDKETKAPQKRQKEDGQTLAQMRYERMMQFIRPLLNVAGYIGDDLYQVLGFYDYKAESETLSLTVPYMFRLVEYAKLHSDRYSAIHKIFHADIMTENQTAVELANRIAIGVILRGVTRPDVSTYKNDRPRRPAKVVEAHTDADGTKHSRTTYYAPEPEPAQTITKTKTDIDGTTITVTGPAKRAKVFSFDAKFSTLIAECPQLQRELAAIRTAQGAEETKLLDAAKKEGRKPNPDELAEARKRDHKTDPQRINKKLKDIFTAAIKIIMEKSDMPQYYKDLRITTKGFDTFKAPTNSTLNNRFLVTHKGKDPTYTD